MAVVEVVEGLGQVEEVLGHSGRLAVVNGDADLGFELGCQIDESPEVVADGLAKEGGGFRLIHEFRQRLAVETRIELFDLAKDAVDAHHGVLEIGAGFPLEAQCLPEIEGDDRIAGVLQQEIAQRAHRDGLGDGLHLPGRESGVASLHLGCRLLQKPVDQIVGLDSQALAARDLHVRAAPVFFRQSNSQILAAGRREAHHLIGEVDGAFGLQVKSQRPQAGDHDVLQVGLAGVDDVVDAFATAEIRVCRILSGIGTGHHDLMAVGIDMEGTIEKIHAQQPQLPELVGDVLAHIGDGAVGTDNDLVLLVPRIAAGGRGTCPAVQVVFSSPHDPASPVPSVGFVVNRLGLLQSLEGMAPEVEVEDVAFLGEQVVGNPDAAHGRQVAADNGSGNVAGNGGGFSLACLDLPKRPAPEFAVLGSRLIEGGHPGVEIPAVVVELAGESLDVLQGLLFQVLEADHHVGHLDAGVVDVVLDFDRLADRAQQPGEGVAQDGVAQVSDVSGLVGVDIGVLQDDLARFEARWLVLGWLQQFSENVIPFQEAIEVAGAGDLHFGHAREIGKILHDLGGDLAGRPPQVPGQFKAKGEGQVPQFDPGRLFRDHLKKGILVTVLDVCDQPVLDTIDQRFQHGASGSGWNPSKNLHPNTVPAKAPGAALHFSCGPPEGLPPDGGAFPGRLRSRCKPGQSVVFQHGAALGSLQAISLKNLFAQGHLG